MPSVVRSTVTVLSPAAILFAMARAVSSHEGASPTTSRAISTLWFHNFSIRAAKDRFGTVPAEHEFRLLAAVGGRVPDVEVVTAVVQFLRLAHGDSRSEGSVRLGQAQRASFLSICGRFQNHFRTALGGQNGPSALKSSQIQ
jgi:hypothetical protein